MDSAGAMLGPLVALAILAVLPTGFDVLFVVSFGIAVVGVGVLMLFVDNKPAPPHEPAAPPLSMGAFRRVFEDTGLRALTAAALVLSLATVSDGFLYLVLQQRAGFRAGLVPLLYVGTAGFYLLIAIPAGRLADRFGRRATFVAGYALLAVGYVAALGGHIGGASVGLCLVSLGAYYAMTDGVLMALASALLPGQSLGTGLAVLTTLTSLGRFSGSVVFGALWTSYGVTSALTIFLGALLCAMAAAGIVLRWSKAADEQPI
jgi:predicted MFS family arabinose efflux permease